MGSVIDQLPGIVVATLGGAAVGVERQRSGHAAGPDARFGGIRTFTLIGGLAGVAGNLAVAGWPFFGALLDERSNFGGSSTSRRLAAT